MLSPEVHTLDQLNQPELPQALLVRAVQIAVGCRTAPLQDKAPGYPGAFSLAESPAVSAIGDELPPIAYQEERLEAMRESKLLGDLMRQARLSKITGCIMLPDKWRNHKGYPKVSSKAAKELGIGYHRELHRVVHFLGLADSTGRPPTPEELSMQVDHKCRNPACCDHTRRMEPVQNNVLKDEAAKIEPLITNGQVFYAEDILAAMPWLLKTLVFEDEARPARVISTRLGPFALRAACTEPFIIYGERIACEVYDSLRPPGKKTYQRPSRARPFKPVEGNGAFFARNKFKKKRVSNQKELYQQALAA